MAPPDEHGITVSNNDGLIDMYPDAAARVFHALDQVQQAFSEALPDIRKVLEQEMTLGNGTAGEMFLKSYEPAAVETFRYTNQTPRVLGRYAQNGTKQVDEYRAVDAENAAALRSHQNGR